MKHVSCPSLEVLATEFKAHVKLVEERLVNDRERRHNVAEELKKQANEYERRLTDLNHAHAQAEKKNQEYISREVFNAAVREMNQKQDQIVTTNNQRHEAAVGGLNQKIDSLQKLVYIGLGIVLASQLILTLYFGSNT